MTDWGDLGEELVAGIIKASWCTFDRRIARIREMTQIRRPIGLGTERTYTWWKSENSYIRDLLESGELGGDL